MTQAAIPRIPRPSGWTAEPMGELFLRVGQRGNRSVAVDQFHRGGQRIVRPHYLDASGQVCYSLINPGGGYLGGDDYLIDIQVDADASLLLTTQAATKVYKTPSAPARQHTSVRLGAGAVLESLPEQVIVYRAGTYLQTTVVEADPSATYIAAEVVTPGWAPDGSRFAYDMVALRTHITRPGADTPLLVDSVILQPDADDIVGLGGLDHFTHVASLLVHDARVDGDLVTTVAESLTHVADARVGVSLAPGPCLVLRALGNDTATLTDVVLRVDGFLRQRWFDQSPVRLRKY